MPRVSSIGCTCPDEAIDIDSRAINSRGMDLFVSLDPTAVCVGLLVLALTLLWAYVSLSGSRREQPKLSVLYEQTTLRPVSGQNKAGKAKGKGKQVRRIRQLYMHVQDYFLLMCSN